MRGWKTTSKLGNMGLANLNGNLICSIDTETTGLKAGHHDVIEIAVVPFNARFEQIKEVAPFNIYIKPKHPENIDPDAMRINGIKLDDLEKFGLEPWRAGEKLDEWFQALQLAPGKKISPLGKNYGSFDAPMIKAWLGSDTYESIFHHRVREVSAVLNYLNDKAEFAGRKPPFPQQDLTSVASRLGITIPRAHSALDDAIATAEVYHRLLKSFVDSLADER